MKLFEPSFSHILKISAPISFSLLVPQISFIINTLFVAALGTVPLTVIGLASIYYLLLTWMGYGINNAMLMFLSRTSGAQDKSGFKSYFQNGCILGISFIIIMSLTTFWGFEPAYKMMIEDKDILEQCQDFINYRMIGFPFLIINQAINMVFISMGNTLKLLWGSIIGNAVNIILDYLLIFGFGGFNAWGVHGAAIGSAMGEMTYCIVMLSFFIKSQQLKSLQLFNGFHISTSRIKEIFKASGPLIFQYIFSIGGWQYFFILMEKRGHEYVAATHILRNALGLIGVGAWALASTSNTMMGNFLGQKNPKFLSIGLKKLIFVAFSFGLSVSVIMYAFRWELIEYYTKDLIVQNLVIDGLSVIYFSSIIMCMSTVVFNAVIGLGDTKMSMIFEVSSVIIYSLYIYYIADVLGLSYQWAWTSEVVYWFLLLNFSGIYFYLKIRKLKKVLK